MRMRAILVLLIAASAAACSASRCHSGDKAALLAIKAALGNPIPLRVLDGRLPVLRLDANLTGAIPDAVAGLAHLWNLRLHHLPGISGPIPPAIARLSNLSFLTISWTAVSGPLAIVKRFQPVPTFLGALTRLSQLDLSFNALAGTVPASLAALPSLYSVDLSRNRLTGSLPPLLFSKAPQVAYLRLSHNNLTGGVPAEFSAVAFAQIDLSCNGFTGDASGLFCRAKPVQQMDLSRNALSFNLSGVELPEQLIFLDVSHNAIYGGVPAQVANLSSLQFFNVSYNQLCGAVPAGGNMARFDAYSFQHNRCLCGAPLANPCT
ncbi:polygalacturonase inhibitor-like [Panicum miliaceum]|uniref:Polygalacturonase inhibitor-like n=1 Tax=Panicum miliaceum TaxID=4540 RepID=A0A3L6R9N9_PANMI|nr:polygalacturonase inhibitor-like [Panicum miliaceum]